MLLLKLVKDSDEDRVLNVSFKFTLLICHACQVLSAPEMIPLSKMHQQTYSISFTREKIEILTNSQDTKRDTMMSVLVITPSSSMNCTVSSNKNSHITKMGDKQKNSPGLFKY